MKIAEALDKINIFRPNQYSEKDKIGWLSNIDMSLYDAVVKQYEGAEEFKGYDETTDIHTTDLLVKEPYAEDIYMYYLAMQIDFYNAEMGKYNNDALMYNTAYTTWRNEYNRVHSFGSKDVYFKL